jgi:general secretion pathway protein D
VATDPEQNSVDTLVNQLDKPTRQVLIETRLVEVNSTPESRKGVDWRGTLQSQNISFGNGNIFGSSTVTTPGTTTGTTPGGGYGTGGHSSTVSSYTTVSGNGGLALSTSSGLMPNVGFLNADGLHAVLSFINSSEDAQIVSTPRVVTLDNETANIEVTRGFPVFNVAAGSANNAGGSTVSYTNVGTKLHVTPRISANDNIWLKVVPEVSSFAGDVSQSVGGGPVTATGQATSQVLSAPTFDFRIITTQVIIPNTDTLVMGGLVVDNPVSTATKVPLLGDIPYLGAAFRSETKTSDKKTLVIFITPTIVKDGDFQLHPNDFLATQPDAKRPVLMNPESMWDSTKPYDWSNPQKEASTSAATP